MKYMVTITKFTVINNKIVIAYYKESQATQAEECKATLYGESLVKLAKNTNRVDLSIPAILDHGTLKINFDHDQPFEGKHEYIVAEIMDE